MSELDRIAEFEAVQAANQYAAKLEAELKEMKEERKQDAKFLEGGK